MADWRDDLERALSFHPSHLSTYELTVEESTGLAAEGCEAPDEDLAADMWHAANELAGAAGLARYEVSNLAMPGFECRHNQDVWHGVTYLGCGPAAASFDGEMRRTNVSDLAAWLSGAVAEMDPLPPEQRAREVLALGLRTTRGWTRDEFRHRMGHDYVGLCGDVLGRMADLGLLTLTETGVRPTERGLLFADCVADALM
jgi:oxygen-independent coproporphyrinogen-3 oxidase